MWFLWQVFKNLGFKCQKQNLGNLKEENLEDDVITHGSNLRRLKIQTCKNKKDWESGNWVVPWSWRVLHVPLTGKHPVINLGFINIMGEKKLKKEGWAKESQRVWAAGALRSKLGQEQSCNCRLWNNKRQRTQQYSEKVFHCDVFWSESVLILLKEKSLFGGN